MNYLYDCVAYVSSSITSFLYIEDGDDANDSPGTVCAFAARSHFETIQSTTTCQQAVSLMISPIYHHQTNQTIRMTVRALFTTPNSTLETERDFIIVEDESGQMVDDLKADSVVGQSG
jgi:hypothetical protein